jgi:hypothetical protein
MSSKKSTRNKKRSGYEILGSASWYLGNTYPFIKNDVFLTTPQRRACEIILHLKDLIGLIGDEA